MGQNNQPPEAETTIVQDVADLFRACGFEVREEAGHQFAVSGSLTSAGLLVEAVLERQPAAPAVDAAKLTEDEQTSLLVKIEDYMDVTDRTGSQLHPDSNAAEVVIYEHVAALIATRAPKALPVDAAELGKLKALAEAATPQNFDSAECQSNDGWIECPHCSGEGTVELTADYCNYDGAPIGVQFYGIGDEHGAAEAYYRAANPAAILRIAALVAQQAARIAELEARDWISVDERLPDDGALIAIRYWPYNNKENAQAVSGAHFFGGTFYDDEGNDCHPPSHWIALPAIPTTTQEGK